MLLRLVVVGVILLLLPIIGMAADELPSGPTTVQEQNRFLSAESVREIRNAKEEMLQEMKDYQDENFQIFDGRMTAAMDAMLVKFVLAGIGAFFAAGAVVAYVMQRSLKRFAIDRYVQAAAEQAGATVPEVPQQGMQQMQQQTWYPQQPTETMGMHYGQQQAAQMTQMNAWQAQPAYDGAWRAPIETQPEYRQTPYGYEAPAYQGANTEDPLQSPGWRPIQ